MVVVADVEAIPTVPDPFEEAPGGLVLSSSVDIFLCYLINFSSTP